MRSFLSKLLLLGLLGFLGSVLLLMTTQAPGFIRFAAELLGREPPEKDMAMLIMVGVTVTSFVFMLVPGFILGGMNNSEAASLKEIQGRFPGAAAAEVEKRGFAPKELGRGWRTTAAPFRLPCGDGEFLTQWCLRPHHRGADSEQLAVLTIVCSHRLGQGVMVLGRPDQENAAAVAGKPLLSAMASLQMNLGDAGMGREVQGGRDMIQNIWEAHERSGPEAAIAGIFTGFAEGFSLCRPFIEKCLFTAPQGSAAARAMDGAKEEIARILKALPLTSPIRGIVVNSGEITVVGAFCNGETPQHRADWIEAAGRAAQAILANDASEPAFAELPSDFSAGFSALNNSEGHFS